MNVSHPSIAEMQLGKLLPDSESRTFYFEADHEKLRPLSKLRWSSYSEAIQAITQYALEAGLGGGHAP